MPRPLRPWFRLYVEVVHDRKLRRLRPEQRWLWVCVLAAARQSPISGVLLVSERVPMTDKDLSDLAAVPFQVVTRTMPVFEEAEMIEKDGEFGAWRVTNWKERQFESDSSTLRTSKHRSKQHRRNVPVAPSESESESKSELLTSSFTHVGSGPDSDDDDRVESAMTILAERDLQQRVSDKGPIRDRTRWLATGVRRRSEAHAEQARVLLAEHPQLTAVELADRLDLAAAVDSPDEILARAAAEQRRRQALPDCPACDNTGWAGADPANGKCPCGRLMTAAELAAVEAAR